MEYEPALDAAILAGKLRIPRDIDPDTIYAADYRGPARPVIDDEKQARGDAIIIETETDSRVGRIRERGRDPVRVDAEIDADSMRQQEPTQEINPDA
jgi:capsid protein